MRNPILYDTIMQPFERLVLESWREATVRGLSGRVLEIGAGTGYTLRHYASLDEVVLTDRSVRMLMRAARRAETITFPVRCIAAAAEHLPFAPDSFDAVVATLALCTVSSPSAAFREIRRVLRDGGELRMFEHVRSANPAVAALQDMLTPAWRAISGGCHLNRDTVSLAREAGFVPLEVRNGAGGWLVSARLAKQGGLRPPVAAR